MIIGARSRVFAATLCAGILLTSALAPAAVDLSTGLIHVVPNGTMAECRSKAQAALAAYLQNPAEATPGEWIARGVSQSNGVSDTTAAGSIHCFAHGSGYVVSFTCAVEAPNNPYDAASLCEDLEANFEGTPQKPLATPTPMPTGCTTANLIGTWQSDGDNKLTLTMTPDGELTGSDGVSGSWYLNGMSAIITYYGNHTMTLSADGKHLRGGGYSFTRKC